MRDEAERAKRMRAAVEAYRAKGGTIRGLARAAGMATPAIYRAMKSGEALGTKTASRLAPQLGVSAGWLLAVDDDQESEDPILAKERAFLKWLREIPPELWPKIREHGDVLADARRAKEGDKSPARDTKGTRPRTARKGSKTGGGRV
jgi:AcrR family transcriptional regulator